MSAGFKHFFRPLVARIKLWTVSRFPRWVGVFYRLFWKPRNAIEWEIHQKSKGQQSFTFLQIGANDGRINDPIFPFIFRDHWQGHRFEPLEVPFNQLSALHKRTPWVVPVKALLGTKSGTAPLYCLAFSSKRWATGLSSLSREQLEAQIASGYVARRAKKYRETLPEQVDHWIEAKEMPVYELNAWIMENAKGRLDLLQIDTEGYDHILLQALDIQRLDVAMICFEKLHIPEAEFLVCTSKLQAAGYRLVTTDCDVLAIRS